jgi:hypothetical protein
MEEELEPVPGFYLQVITDLVGSRRLPLAAQCRFHLR